MARVFDLWLDTEQSAPLVQALSERSQAWVDFMMRFELGLDQPEPGRAFRSALTMALAYIGGGMIPLSPYLLIGQAHPALVVSVVVTY